MQKLPASCCHASPVRDAPLPADPGYKHPGLWPSLVCTRRSGPESLLTTAQRFLLSRFACSRRSPSRRLRVQTSGPLALLGLHPSLWSRVAAHDGSALLVVTLRLFAALALGPRAQASGPGPCLVCTRRSGPGSRLPAAQRCSFSRSRISASSFSSAEGSGGAGSSAGASSFLRWRLFKNFTMQNTAKARIIKSRMVDRRVP